jgi:hypothetical protein
VILKNQKSDVVFGMGIKGRLFLGFILITVMLIIIDSTVPEDTLRSVLNGLSVGITTLVVNLIASKRK